MDITYVPMARGFVYLAAVVDWFSRPVLAWLWRSIKYEEVYLRAYGGVGEARASIGRYLKFYNGRRPHSSLDRQTPDRTYFNRLPQVAAA